MSVAPELRRAALERAASMRDPRIAEALRRTLPETRERAGEAWESSEGTVRAIDVRLLVDGHALGILETSPAVRDAVIEAITAAAPAAIGGSVVELSIVWALREHPAESGYRGEASERVDPESDDDVRRALVGYLLAIGDRDAARAIDAAELRVGMREAFCDAGIEPARLESPLRAILGRRIRVVDRR